METEKFNEMYLLAFNKLVDAETANGVKLFYIAEQLGLDASQMSRYMKGLHPKNLPFLVHKLANNSMLDLQIDTQLFSIKFIEKNIL